MTKQGAMRAASARKMIAERFLAMPDVLEQDPPELVVFPAYVQPSGVRYTNEGDLKLSFTVPATFAMEAHRNLVQYMNRQLSVSLELVELPDA